MDRRSLEGEAQPKQKAQPHYTNNPPFPDRRLSSPPARGLTLLHTGAPQGPAFGFLCQTPSILGSGLGDHAHTVPGQGPLPLGSPCLGLDRSLSS